MHLFINGILDPVFSIHYISKCTRLTASQPGPAGLLFVLDQTSSLQERSLRITELRQLQPGCVYNSRSSSPAFLLTLNADAVYSQWNAMGLPEAPVIFPSDGQPKLLNREQAGSFEFLFKKLFDCCKQGPDAPQMMKYSWLYELVRTACQICLTPSFPDPASWKGEDTIHGVICYLKTNYTESITVDTLASDFYISKFHLMREFKKVTGCTIHTFLLHERISQAQHMLSKGIHAGTVSALVGFSDYSLFYRSFVKLTGLTPREYHTSCGLMTANS